MFPPSTRVLVVDDMGTMRKLVMKVCIELGMKDLTEAVDGQTAWVALQAANPPIGLVISDWNMPNMSGLDFLKLCRGTPKYKQLPFLLVTAEAETKQVLEAIRAEVSNYVVKPFTSTSLTDKIEAVYKKHNKAA